MMGSYARKMAVAHSRCLPLVGPTHSRRTGLRGKGLAAKHPMRAEIPLSRDSQRSSLIALQCTIGNQAAQHVLAAAPIRSFPPAGHRPIEAPSRLRARVLQRQPHDAFDPARYPAAPPTQVVTWQGVNMRIVNANYHAAGLPMPYGPSDVLRAELVGAGVPDPTAVVANQAHHIVERNDPNAGMARAYLAALGIDLDAAANGVFLPSERSDYAGTAAIHLGAHVPEYAELVNEALTQAINATGIWAGRVLGMGHWPPLTVAEWGTVRAAILACLAQIRAVLLMGGSSLNRGERTDSAWEPNPGERDPKDRSPEGGSRSLRADFRAAGLVV